MAKQSRSISQESYSILRLGSFSEICKQLVSKCRHHKKNSGSEKVALNGDPKSTKDECKASEYNNYNHVNKNGMHVYGSPRGISNHQNHENNYFTQSPRSTPSLSRNTSPLNSRNASLSRSRSISPSLLSRNGSARNQVTPKHTARTSLLRTMSKKNSNVDSSVMSSLSRSMSPRSSTRIMYSNSSGIVKPPAIEETLECTLEELCFGCIKKIRTTRNAITNDGKIIEEHEVLTIKVKPGWKNGTKITFEGMEKETDLISVLPADIIFTIVEKQHHLFRREGDDLELVVEIPLVEALTGCILPIPLLGGEKLILTMDDIIHPGYKKVIEGQGMTKSQEQGKRANLIITFLVEFPIELTEQQRSDIISTLQSSF